MIYIYWIFIATNERLIKMRDMYMKSFINTCLINELENIIS